MIKYNKNYGKVACVCGVFFNHRLKKAGWRWFSGWVLKMGFGFCGEKWRAVVLEGLLGSTWLRMAPEQLPARTAKVVVRSA